MPNTYVKFHGATYVLAAPGTPQQLNEFVTASLRRSANEEPLQRMARLIKVAQYVLAQQPPPTPHARIMETLETEVVGALNDFFKSLRVSTDMVEKLPLSAMTTGTGALGELNKVLSKSTAAKSLQLAKQHLAEAAKVFPAIQQANLGEKIDKLAGYWDEWNKYLLGGKWMEGVRASLKQMEQGRDTLKKMIIEIQRPVAQIIEKAQAGGQPSGK